MRPQTGLMMDRDDPIAAENAAVLMVVHAMLGMICPDWDAITVRARGNRVIIRVWVDDAEAAAEAVEEAVFNVEAIAAGDGREIDDELSEGTIRPYNREQHGRLVYLRHLPIQRRKE